MLAISPLSKFLQDMEYEGESRLAAVASEVAYEPFDAGRFRLELKDRLQRLRYPQPVEREKGKRHFMSGYERETEFAQFSANPH